MNKPTPHRFANDLYAALVDKGAYPEKAFAIANEAELYVDMWQQYCLHGIESALPRLKDRQEEPS